MSSAGTCLGAAPAGVLAGLASRGESVATSAAVTASFGSSLSRWLAFVLLFAAAIAVAAILSLFAYREVLGFQANWPRYHRRARNHPASAGRNRGHAP